MSTNQGQVKDMSNRKIEQGHIYAPYLEIFQLLLDHVN
jgi:hypothetical protein